MEGELVDKKRFPPVRVKVLTFVGATFVAIFLGELLVRGIAPAPPTKAIELGDPNCVYKRSNNPVLGFELKTNYTSANPDYINSYEQTNAHGLRDHERSLKKSAKKRVLLLGDSVVEGYGLPQQATISNQLEIVANGEYEALNFGVSAYCTLAEIELLETKGIQFDPDIVVLVFVENDFDNFNREAFPLDIAAARPVGVEFLFEQSHLFRKTCLQFNFFQFRAQTDPVAWNAEAIGENNVTVGLKRFRELADKHPFQPVIAIWPRFTQHEVVDVHYVPEREQLIVEAVAARFALPTVRLSDYFKQNSRKIGIRSPKLAFSQGDELHPSATGAKVAAEAIHEVISNGIDQLPIANTTSDENTLRHAIAKLGDKPNYARVHNRIGNRLLKEGKTEAAIQRYSRALEEAPENAATHNNLGIALQRSNEQNAADHFREAIKLEPDFAEAHFNLGTATEANNPQAAQQLYIKAIQLKPDFLPAHLQLSKSLLRVGRTKAGEAGLREILRMDSQHAEAMVALANELARQGRNPEARQWYERVLPLTPDNAEILNNLGAVCSALGDTASAEQHFTAAVRLAPNHPKAAKNLAKLKALRTNN